RPAERQGDGNGRHSLAQQARSRACPPFLRIVEPARRGRHDHAHPRPLCPAKALARRRLRPGGAQARPAPASPRIEDRTNRPADRAASLNRSASPLLETIIAAIASFIVATISASGYAGVALLMAIESACIPLPSEIIMPFSGYLVFTGRFDLVAVATAGAIGCNLGSTVAYAIGYYGGRPLVEKWGAYVMVSRRDLALVDRFF